jgi:DNA repair exonuclease SbcCD ATPase subunit
LAGIFSTKAKVTKLTETKELSMNKDSMITKKNEIELMQQKYDIKKEHQDKLNEDKEVKVNEYASEIQSCRETIRTLHREIDDLERQKQTYTEVCSKIPENEKKITAFKKVESKIESKISQVGTDRDFYEHNADCPTCRQAIASEFKETELQTLQTKATECEHGLTQLEVKLLAEQTKLNEITEIQRRIQTLQIEIATKNTSIIETNKYITKVEKIIEELKTNKASTEKEEEELKTLNDTLTGLKSNLRHLIDEKSYYEVASGLLKDTGIKTKIIKQYLPIINKLVNKYLASLDFFVNFNLDESFKETIKSRHRDDFTYNNFSEGEKQRIDMALMLTWRAVAKLKNSSNTNLLILDEVFDSSLDTTGTEELMKILHMLDGVNLFVISHKGDILQDKFSNVIKFAKEKNFSRILK